jgi:4-azaleucine resistance transporter AzlC
MYKQNNDFVRAVKYSVPVLLGYLAIGVAFGLMLVNAGYPWELALVMSIFMYAGAGQYAAVGLFAAGAGLLDCILIEFVINARHMAYGITMFKRFNASKPFKWYLIFAMSDETFALLSSLPDSQAQGRFMFFVAALDQCYWIAGSVIGAIAGTLIPFDMKGVSFALTALFIVLMIEQILKLKRPGPFIISGLAAVAGVVFLPERISLLGALAGALALVELLAKPQKRPANG